MMKQKYFYIYTMDKIVKIDPKVEVILIPSRNEYFKDNLESKIWYNDYDYNKMKKIRDNEIKVLTCFYHGDVVKAVDQWKKNMFDYF